jgi:flagellar protein FliL
MSDEEFLNEEEGGGGGGGDQVQASKKVGILPGFIIQILKWVALGLGAVIFIVTIVIVTVGILNSGSKTQTYQNISTEYKAKDPVLEWYRSLEEVRGRTADETPHTVVANVFLGYAKGNKAINIELGERTPEIRDILRSFFTSKKADEIRPEMEEALKAEIKERINMILTEGKIDKVIFDNLVVVEF